tara:strand:+ start:33 stop:248 length:216 start_codon:yes stop_codon:yes gene_type:complete
MRGYWDMVSVVGDGEVERKAKGWLLVLKWGGVGWSPCPGGSGSVKLVEFDVRRFRLFMQMGKSISMISSGT